MYRGLFYFTFFFFFFFFSENFEWSAPEHIVETGSRQKKSDATMAGLKRNGGETLNNSFSSTGSPVAFCILYIVYNEGTNRMDGRI